MPARMGPAPYSVTVISEVGVDGVVGDFAESRLTGRVVAGVAAGGAAAAPTPESVCDRSANVSTVAVLSVDLSVFTAQPSATQRNSGVNLMSRLPPRRNTSSDPACRIAGAGRIA